ncbi:hypothetical protein Patl1_01860 [Pistacia atlantica]|uniref:Uncharacterized protein n=1 Tax=Pistacia atlantica TaxID=434234 RepID=A0ACC1C4S6_9ROSI|nr:hypothetical protein Patl1_01860 [Pistacia atlantica]
MSCYAGAGVFVKLSGLFVRWIFLMMSMTCKFGGSNGVVPAGSKLKKTKEALHGLNCVKRWRKNLLFLLLLGFVTILSIWFLSRLETGALWRNKKTPDSCEKKAKIFLQHFNVSNNQLHALANLFSASDQISSLECTKEPGTGMPLSKSIACALKVPCSEKQELQKRNKLVAENVERKDQCPVKDVKAPWKLDRSVLADVSLVSKPNISPISPSWQNFRKNLLQIRAWRHHAREYFKISYFYLVKEYWWVLAGMILSCIIFGLYLELRGTEMHMLAQSQQQHRQQHQQPPKRARKWRRKFLLLFFLFGISMSFFTFYHLYTKMVVKRKETLASMCDERARMLQDQFNVSMNHVHALAILVSTFHHRKHPSAMDQATFGIFTEKTAFERPLTSGVAYALKVLHSDREQFEKQHGWTIKKMETEDQTLVQDCVPENLDPAPVQDEYAPVVFAQQTVSHIVSIDMMSGKEDRENILRARASGKGVLTSPFKLLKSNHLGVVLTFAVYKTELPPDATPKQHIEATVGYLGASYDVPSLVEKLLNQLASTEDIIVNVYDTTNASAYIRMYGTDICGIGLPHISSLDFGDPMRRHEIHCRYTHKAPLPWTAINASVGLLIITCLVSHIFNAAISRITQVEKDYLEMMELKARAEAADVAKSQFLATVSHEIRTPMNGVLGMLQMLMHTDLDAEQMEFAETALASGKDLITLINDVLDQAKIESGKLEPESVPFDVHLVLDNILSLFSGKCSEKGIEKFAVYVSDQVPEVVIGDPGRFRQIITNLVGNSIKFIRDKGHIFVSLHLADEVSSKPDVQDKVLQQSLRSDEDESNKECRSLSGFPVVNRWNSWKNFKMLNNKDTTEQPEIVKLLVSVEDTGVGIPLDAQSRIFTPFMQADSSTSRTYGGTGIGLSISRCLVELMGGEIGFVSAPNTGSTFSFTVAFRKGEAGPLDKWQHYDPAIRDFQGLRALVIDDRSIRAEVTRYHLQRLGIAVDITDSIQSACTFISDTCSPSMLAQLAIVLVDKDVWNKETGLAFHQLLKQQRQKGGPNSRVEFQRIFLLATYINPAELNELKLDGVIDLRMKPLRLSALFGWLQEALGSNKKWEVNRKKNINPGNLLKGKRILVVDDNKVNRRVAEGALSKYGAIVTCVESGSTALQMLKPPHDFDACFMDLQMPEMDGFEATRQIRCIENKVNDEVASSESSSEIRTLWHVPILAMTADVIQATNEKCMNCGMDGYVSKPFEEEQLYFALSQFFESG